MLNQLETNRILWSLAAGLTLVAAVAGVVNPAIYHGLVDEPVLPGILSQDIISVVAALVVLMLAARATEAGIVGQIIALGIMGYLFYAYGVYVIERLYNGWYLVYMAIFALAFWAMVYGLASLRRERLGGILVPRGIRIASVAYLFFNPLVFYPLWISQLLPLMRTGEQIRNYYSIYILDLCFIMPAFIMAGAMAARKRGLGLFVTPALFVWGFTLLFPLALGEWLKPSVYGLPIDMGGMMLYLILSLVFAALTWVYVRTATFSARK